MRQWMPFIMIMKVITTKPSNVPLDFLDLDDLARIYI